MAQRRGFVLLAYAHHAPQGWRSVVDVHHGYLSQRVVREDGAVDPYLRLVGPEPGLHVADWCLREFGLTRRFAWRDVGLVDGARMWRSEAGDTEQFQARVAQMSLARPDREPGEDWWLEYTATTTGPFSEAM